MEKAAAATGSKCFGTVSRVTVWVYNVLKQIYKMFKVVQHMGTNKFQVWCTLINTRDDLYSCNFLFSSESGLVNPLWKILAAAKLAVCWHPPDTFAMISFLLASIWDCCKICALGKDTSSICTFFIEFLYWCYFLILGTRWLTSGTAKCLAVFGHHRSSLMLDTVSERVGFKNTSFQ